MSNIQIPLELFQKLIQYHILEVKACSEEIKKGLEQKLDALILRELYSKYKCAPTKEEREKARQEYLDKRGIHKDFRW